jgi:hypothetical protein
MLREAREFPSKSTDENRASDSIDYQRDGQRDRRLDSQSDHEIGQPLLLFKDSQRHQFEFNPGECFSVCGLLRVSNASLHFRLEPRTVMPLRALLAKTKAKGNSAYLKEVSIDS